VQTIPAETLDLQNVANVLNAYAKLGIRDEPLLAHMCASIAALDLGPDSAVDRRAQEPQAVANMLHALAVLNFPDPKALGILAARAVLHDPADAQPQVPRPAPRPPPRPPPPPARGKATDGRAGRQGVANICWAAAVLQLRDPALLGLCSHNHPRAPRPARRARARIQDGAPPRGALTCRALT
jgi:hypothetical protein